MRKLHMIFMALLALGLRAQAQETPRAEVFTGYSFLSAQFPLSTDPAAGETRGSMNGWNFSAAVNANRWFGVVGGFGGYYNSPTQGDLFKPANCVNCTGGVSATVHNIYTFTAGPQISMREENLTAFVHVLLGGAHTRADLVSNVTPSASISATTFALMVGGGVDIGFSPRFALRIQPDYFKSSILDRRQNNVRVSAGIVFRFGHK
jgi:Outer membrane protein beta-barrel domain